MATELWLASMQGEGDHRVTRTLAGEVELLRARLAEAAERLGYQVIADQTAVVARRRARGAGRTGCSLDVRDYPTELIVTLKPKGSAAALVTFNFNVRNYYYWTKGDRATLALEADALAALAVAQPTHGACAACGTETTDDSRFCRRCGAPLALEEPAELETLRLAAGARAAQKNISWGLVTMLLTAAIMLLVLLLGESERADRAAVVAAAIGGTTGLFMLLAGAWRLRHTLGAAREGSPERRQPEASDARTFGAARPTNALPPRAAQFSVTESATELLEPRERVAATPRSGEGDTGPIN